MLFRSIARMPQELPPRLGLYAAITQLTDGYGRPGGPAARHLLLLTAVEELSLPDAARVVGLNEDDAIRDMAAAREAVRMAVATRVLVIEDEPVIAMDLSMLLEDCGHSVVGVAASEAEALRIATEHSPGLILADINLGRGGNGVAAVRRILEHAAVPVIFVTAYPEKLLMAEGVEPAFVMRKPFDRFMLATFTYQAITAGRVPLV